MVIRSRMVWGRLVMDGWVMWMAFILDISNVAAIAMRISVVIHDLPSAVWKGNLVGSCHLLAIGGFVLAKVDTRVLVLDTILVLVWPGGVMGGFMVVCRWTSR